jgi:hypothetical protein
MDDVPEGGGAATGAVIPDGVMNNVFEDISDLDRAMGRFNLRKVFLGVRALNTDLYGGAKLVVTQLPEDNAIGYALFTTQDAFDNRANAQNRVEAYLFKGPMWHGALQSNHIIGMKAINVIQRENTPVPVIGKTLCLVEDEGLAGQREQYVRVTKVTVTRTTFTDGSGDFHRWIVRLDISDPLRFDFTGHDASRQDAYNYTGRARLRDTVVADATRFYGTQRLAEAGSIGDRTIRAQSQFSQLVPAARIESALVGQPMNPDMVQTISGGTRTVSVPQQAHTRALAVTAENRALNWVSVLQPRPAQNALTVSFRAQGNWYTLLDNGNGTLSGLSPAEGTGTINYSTGDLSVTLGALPDAGSQIQIVWASPVHYTARSGANAANSANARFNFTLQKAPLQPATLVLTWLEGATTRTATAAANGAITGNATGTVDHSSGEVELILTRTPNRGTMMTAAYSWLRPNDPGQESAFFTVQRQAHTTTTHLHVGVTPSSIRGVARWFGLYGRTYDVRVQGHADGTLRTVATKSRRISYAGDVIVGTYDSTTGNITWSGTASYDYMAWQWMGANMTWTPQSFSRGKSPHGIDTLSYSFGNTTPEARTEPHPIAALLFRLLPNHTDFVVANSVRFVFGGHTYDDNNGTIVNASALSSGSINYETGDVTLNWWVDDNNVSPNVTSLLTRFGLWHTEDASFRAAASPLNPESLSVVAVTMEGDELVGTADANGIITGTKMLGAVNYEFGTATVAFGEDTGSGWEPARVDPGSIRYSAVVINYIPLDASIIGVDGVRLPPDGRVPIFRPGDVAMVMHTAETAPVTPTQGTPVSLGRTRVGWVRVINSTGATVTEGYTLNRAAGTVTFSTVPANTPVKIRHTIADLRLITDAQIGGQLTLARELSHNFPAEESLVGSCLLFGDRRARVSHVWDQVSWNSTWSDSLVGSEATATLNTIDFPITVTNEGCDTDRWILRVVNASSNQWELISEKRGLVWTGVYAPNGDDIAPINPRTRVWDAQGQVWMGGTPYMTIPGAANGGGWSNGNVVRINTVGAIADFWIARSIAQSDEPLDDGADGCEIYALGNIDRP